MTNMVFGGQTPQAVYLGDIKLFPSDAPDLGDALIQWGTDTVLTLNLAAATIHGGPLPGGVVIGAPPLEIPAAANLRLTPLADGQGVRVQADSWAYDVDVTDGFMGKGTAPYFNSYVDIPVTGIARSHDARSFKAGSPKMTGAGIVLQYGDTPGAPGAGVPSPDLSVTPGQVLPWSIQRWIYPAPDITTGTVSLDVSTYPGAAVTLTSGTALAAMPNPTFRFLISTGGVAAATPVGHYSGGALALDAEVRGVLVSQIAVAP